MSQLRGWMAQMRGYMAAQKAAGAKGGGGFANDSAMTAKPSVMGGILIGIIAFIITTILMGFSAFPESDLDSKIKAPCCPNWNSTGDCPAPEYAAGLCAMCQAVDGEIAYAHDMGIAAFVISIFTFFCIVAEWGISKSAPANSPKRTTSETAIHSITPAFYCVLLALSAVLVGHRAARGGREAWEIARSAGASGTMVGDCAFKPATIQDDDEGWSLALGTVICVCVYIVLRACLDSYYARRMEVNAVGEQGVEMAEPPPAAARITTNGYTAVSVDEPADETPAPITVGARRRTTSPDGGAEATSGATRALGGKRESRSGRRGAPLGSLVF